MRRSPGSFSIRKSLKLLLKTKWGIRLLLRPCGAPFSLPLIINGNGRFDRLDSGELSPALAFIILAEHRNTQPFWQNRPGGGVLRERGGILYMAWMVQKYSAGECGRFSFVDSRPCAPKGAASWLNWRAGRQGRRGEGCPRFWQWHHIRYLWKLSSYIITAF